uniref:Alpha-2-macroglobulin-like 1 n=1 Tax=Cyprinus carpio TaxID=7962 RepID=A0A8C2Q1B2_CYPCA
QGAKTSLNKTTKILINPPQNLLFIQSDKPIYKPGQTSNSSLCKLFRNSLSCQIGILDLSHSMSPEAAQGFYTITAWDEKNQQISHSFEIKEYVLPKYEVNIDFPSILTFQDKEVTLKVCAKYTYGKPVLGSVNAEVCSQSYGYYWRRPSPDMINICKKYSMTTDKTGCGSQVVNMTEFGLTSAGSLQVNCNVEESGTGEKYLYGLCTLCFSMHLSCFHKCSLSFIKENRGELTFSLKSTAALTPYAQVVVYTVLPSGEAVADSMNFPIEECLPNKVSLKFSSPTALPGERTSLNLKASPGSLCSVRAIDQSVLLLRPEAELDAASDLEMPFLSDCIYKLSIQTAAVDNARMDVDLAGPEIGFGSKVSNPPQKIRKFFPETWIWDLIPVGYLSCTVIVPDTITKWAAGAFCTSPVGLGVAPKTDLTAFKPFFVSLTLPYSLIREETFTLKASVFNYLPKCIMVKVTLADSPQFTAQPCRGCTYTQCVCSEESKTFQWIITPSALGKVNITVRAEAVQSRELCGNEVVTLPDKGRIDTVMQSVLVEKIIVCSKVQHDHVLNMMFFFSIPLDSPQETSVSLTLPKVFVKDSAKSFVTVLGDLMGRALRNIGDLLAMPYGCGEQNMLNFAPNIYILQYLESTGQLTPQIKDRAITFLDSGYQRELTYKHYDGSYSAFGNSDPSGNTWLTAFVMKSFGGARQYIFIDQNNIDQAKEWLGQQQQENGCFASVGRLFHIDMMGGVSNEVTLSAYITAALLELGDPMVVRSLTCLRESSSDITNTYVTALLSYTFTLAGDEQMRQNLISNLDNQARREGVGRYWTLANNVQPTGSLEVETSAYVLLALLSGPTLPRFGLNYSAGIVHWLSKQQNAYGGFSSTQDTVVALQALAKYSAAIYNPEGSITVTVTSPSGQKNQFTVNQNNRLLYQEKRLQEVTGTYKLRAEGKGCVFVQFALHYNIPPPPDSLAFKISANTGVCKNTTNPAFPLTTTVR